MLYKYSILNDAKITCVDMSIEMYEAMTNLIEYINPNEVFSNQAWTDMKFDKKFNLIISDFTNSNIDADQKDKYFNKIIGHIKDDGAFITRDNVIPDNYKEVQTISKVFIKYLKIIASGKLTLKQTSTHIGNEMSLISWHRNNKNIVSTKYLLDDIKKFGKIIKEEPSPSKNLQFIIKIYDYFIENWYKIAKDKYWSCLKKTDNDKMLKKYFLIEKELYAKDYDELMIEASPMYLLRKKNYDEININNI